MILIFTLTTSTFAYGKLQANATTDTYFVAFESKIDKNVIKRHGGVVDKQYKHIPVVTAKLSGKAVEALIKNPNIAYVEKDAQAKISSQIVPWGIPHVKATDTQNLGYTGKGVKVGIIDTGIDYTHEDLQVSGGINIINGTADNMDDNGHGTHVAGTVASINNGLGVIGTAPQAELYAIKVLDKNGSGSYSDVVAGIEWAIDNNLNIINMSLGGTFKSKTLEKVVDKAYDSGILLVAAAGNYGYARQGTITYPAAHNSVIAVGAVDQQNNRAYFSSVGRQLELMAPGVDILSTIPNNKYDSYNGTSMASPHTAGVAALVWEAKPELTNVQLRNSLNKTATYLGDSFDYGNGLVNALEAIKYQETPKKKGKKNSRVRN